MKPHLSSLINDALLAVLLLSIVKSELALPFVLDSQLPGLLYFHGWHFYSG
jgi:hypothetical protein